MKHKIERQLIHIGRSLRELVIIRDAKGTIMQRAMHPLMLEFHPHDILQVIVGSMLLAIPVGFTEEVWRLGETLSWTRVLLLSATSLLFISSFVYAHSYRKHWGNYKGEFFKRVLGTYVFSMLVAALFLLFIDKAPWDIDMAVAIKRTIIVAFPASMSAAVADMIK
jgi:uncharacterized membrane protein